MMLRERRWWIGVVVVVVVVVDVVDGEGSESCVKAQWLLAKATQELR